jgi:DNA-binding NtrC family response regulator
MTSQAFPEDFDAIFGVSAKMRQVGTVVRRIGGLPTPVLVRGESGVGKEIVASAIHHFSDRSAGKFVKVVCASLPSGLLEAELFGDAHGNAGKVREAGGGTLFLDEVSDASPSAQARLIGVLDDYANNPRVIAATSADMYSLVATGRFRGDLYERLAVATVDVPPLRERREELDGLIRHFLQRFSLEYHRPVPPVSEAMTELLHSYDWPGNVRELENIVKRWVVLDMEQQVREEIQARREAFRRAHTTANGSSLGLRDIARQAAREAEKSALQNALSRCGGNRAAAARQLKVSYKTLLQKLAETGLSDTQRSDLRSRNT